jgi:hypothetical protein
LLHSALIQYYIHAELLTSKQQPEGPHRSAASAPSLPTAAPSSSNSSRATFVHGCCYWRPALQVTMTSPSKLQSRQLESPIEAFNHRDVICFKQFEAGLANHTIIWPRH